MATDPLALQPTETPVPQEPGFFDGSAQLPTMDQPMPLAQPDPIAPQPMVLDPMAPAPQEQENVQVAGMMTTKIVKEGAEIVSDLLGRLNNFGFDAKKQRGPQRDNVERQLGDQKADIIDDVIVVREATDADIKEFNELTGKTSGVPSPSAGQKAAGIPVADVNLERIESPDDIKETIDKMAQLHQSKGPVTHESVIEDAKAHGLEDVVEKLLKRQEGDAINFKAAEIHKALQAITSSALQLNRLAEAAADVNAGPVDLVKFRQHFAFHAALQSSMQGLQADVGRALGIFKIPRGPSGIQADNLGAMLQDLGGEKSVQDMAKHYLAMPTQAMKNKFAEKGFIARTSDMWYEVWINGILSGVQTQVVNLTGNGLFAFLQPFERLGAGAIGAVRRALGTDQETVFAGEAVDMAMTWLSASIDGARLAGQAFWRDQPMFDALGKIENAGMQAITAKNAGVSMQPFAGMIDYLGKGIRMPGRLLMTGDEFFKAFNYRVELAAQAGRKRRQMELDGATTEEIDDAVNGIFTDPPDDIHGRAEEMARINTFTNATDGGFALARKGMMKVPGGRYVMPFFRVVYNITSGVVDRSPLGFVKAMRATDPIERDLAISKAAIGSAMAAGASYWASQGQLTGTGPANYELRKQLEDIGWKQYSIVRPKVDNPRSIYIGQMRILHPDDVDYISYHRMEPLSMLLAISADATQRLSYPDTSSEDADNIALQITDATFEYLKDQSFLASFAMLAEALSQGPKGNQGFLSGMISSQMPYSSLLNSVASVMKGDEPLENTATNPREPAVLRELYAGLRRMDQRTPINLGTNVENLPDRRNRFYEPMYRKKARVVDHVLPPWVQTIVGLDPEKIKADPVKLEILRVGVPMNEPAKVAKGVKLSPWERDEINRLVNFGVGEQSMYEEIKELIGTKYYQEASIVEKRNEIEAIESRRTQDAIELIRQDEKYFDLDSKIREREQILGSKVQVR